MPVEQQVISIYIVTSGILDSIPVDQVRAYEAGYMAHLSSSHKGILDSIKEKKEMTKEVEQQVQVQQSITSKQASNFVNFSFSFSLTHTQSFYLSIYASVQNFLSRRGTKKNRGQKEKSQIFKKLIKRQLVLILNILKCHIK